MQNIWAIVVGIVLVGGVGISLSQLLGDDESELAAVSQPRPAPAAETARAGGGAPKAETEFGTIEIGADEFTLGRSDAPITIVEYASLTCPHCARFHADILPALKTEFIDTGKVRIVFRDFPLDRLALAAAMTARCAGRDRYFGFIDTFFARQASWARDSDPLGALGRLARLGGMSQADFDACLKNQAVGDAVLKQRQTGEKTFKINSTPTLIINGAKYSGGLNLDQLRAVIAAMLSKS